MRVIALGSKPCWLLLATDRVSVLKSMRIILVNCCKYNRILTLLRLTFDLILGLILLIARLLRPTRPASSLSVESCRTEGTGVQFQSGRRYRLRLVFLK